MKPLKIDTPIFTLEIGANPYEKAWAKLRAEAKYQPGDFVRSAVEIYDRFLNFTIPKGTRGHVTYAGTCENYEVDFEILGGRVSVPCIKDELEKSIRIPSQKNK